MELGCTRELRKSPQEPNKCIVSDNYTQLRTAEFDYRFGDSINILAIDSPATEGYDYILRTDVDTFFTPAFATYTTDIVHVGKGWYGDDDVIEHLDKVSRDMGLVVGTGRGIGPAWYGPADVIKDCAKLSVKVMKYLHENEFKETTRNQFNWPNWHYGVLSLYSGHIAIQHCTHNHGGFEKQYDLLDKEPNSQASRVWEHPHLHCAQTDDWFSKFKFNGGNYT